MGKKGTKWSEEARARRSQMMKGKKPQNINYDTRKKPNREYRKYIVEDKRIRMLFHWMHTRCIRSDRLCGFPRTVLGFKEFVEEMGPIPSDMKRPSVGRIEHDFGYIKGNVQWEEFKFNSWKKRRSEKDPSVIERKRKPPNNTDEEIPF